MQVCDQTCGHCAREFFRWWHETEAKMSRGVKKKNVSSPPFMQEVVSSRLKEGMVVTFGPGGCFRGEIVKVPEFRALDGVWRVGVMVTHNLDWPVPVNPNRKATYVDSLELRLV